MKTSGTKYYHVKQIIKNGKVIGVLYLIGRQYGYIVQLHYFDKPGYKVNKSFDSFEKAENYFYEIINLEVTGK